MADGSVLIDSKINTKGAQEGAKDLEDILDEVAETADESAEEVKEALEEVSDSIEDVDSGAEGAGAGTDNFFGKLVAADAVSNVAVSALKEIGEAMLDFAADSVEAAADIQAQNAQFEQTFQDMAATATASLQAISKETGVAASRMKGSYTSIFAFSKSVGADQKEALDIADRALKAAADSAAYYDRSIEDATETLQSFLKGNYENDAALGIAATETTRNAKANELYATSFEKLSEAQKVDVLLAMVEAGNAASGALGQAAREADSWTNVTGEAAEAFRQLKAVVGEPILDALIPVIQDATQWMTKLAEGTDGEQIAENMEQIADSFADAGARLDETGASIEGNAVLAERYVQKLEELEAAGLETAEAQSQYAGVVSILNDLIPELNLAIDEQTGLIDKSRGVILAEVDALKKRALYEAAMERYSSLLETQADAALAAEAAQRRLMEIEQEKVLIQEQLVAASEAHLGTDHELTAQLVDLEEEEAQLNMTIAESNELIAQAEIEAANLTEDYGNLAEASNDASAAQSSLSSTAQAVWQEVDALQAEYDAATASALESVNAQIGLFDQLATESEMSADEIVANWEAQKTAFDNYAANLQTAIDMGLDEALVAQLSDGSEQSMLVLDELVNGTGTSVEEINTAFAELSSSKELVSQTMIDIGTEIDDQLNAAKESANEIAIGIGQTIDEGLASQSSIVARTMYLMGQEAAASYEAGFNSVSGSGVPGGTVSAGAAVSPFAAMPTAAEVPYLASGAVIPPNAPFLAMLGDQRSGTNIEAPLDTIKQAVSEVLGSNGTEVNITFSGDLAQLARILKPEIDVENTRVGSSLAKGGKM